MHSVTDMLRLDATALRVLAHPLRARLLSALRMMAPGPRPSSPPAWTPTAAPRATTSASWSRSGWFATPGRRPASDGSGSPPLAVTSWEPSDFAGDPDAEASLAWLTGFYRTPPTNASTVGPARHRLAARHWRDTLGSGDDGVMVTASQAREMWEEIDAVIRRYHDAGAGDPTRSASSSTPTSSRRHHPDRRSTD